MIEVVVLLLVLLLGTSILTYLAWRFGLFGGKLVGDACTEDDDCRYSSCKGDGDCVKCRDGFCKLTGLKIDDNCSYDKLCGDGLICTDGKCVEESTPPSSVDDDANDDPDPDADANVDADADANADADADADVDDNGGSNEPSKVGDYERIGYRQFMSGPWASSGRNNRRVELEDCRKLCDGYKSVAKTGRPCQSFIWFNKLPPDDKSYKSCVYYNYSARSLPLKDYDGGVFYSK